ncbi:MAG: methyltransferase domain-containing protein [Acidobacteriota bacterium]|nr:methyltransferase domain-containing protein [Acidobacteriota bacterium]
MNPQDVVRDYFDREAKRFDAIYETDKSLVQRTVDRVFRGVVLERFHLICTLAPSPGPWTALDVGCGSGRYSVALAKSGAIRVVGVDGAAQMIELARTAAREAGVADRCDFEVTGFLERPADERFDVVVATGYFDYLDDPLPHLQRMVAMGRHRLFLSFPKRWEPRVLVRRVRFWLEKGFVRFYAKREVEALMQAAGIPKDRYALIDLGRDWIAVVRVEP